MVSVAVSLRQETVHKKTPNHRPVPTDRPGPEFSSPASCSENLPGSGGSDSRPLWYYSVSSEERLENISIWPRLLHSTYFLIYYFLINLSLGIIHYFRNGIASKANE
jgi:hypothetical protein